MLKNRTSVIAAAAAIAAMAGGGSLLTMAASSASASARPAVTASWRVARTVTGRNFPEFTAVTAASASSAWAFESGSGNARPRAYELRNGSWQLASFPGQAGEEVLSASSSSSGNVWVITANTHNSHDRALRFNGHGWTQVRSFPQTIGSLLALSSTNVWVFNADLVGPTQAFHYNGRTWTRSGGSRGLFGGSALSASSIWAYGDTNVSHYNGRNWSSTSVRKLLPKNTELCGSRLTGIDAITAKNIFAIGTGGCQDQLGPFVLLHYNGSKWSRIALRPSLGAPSAISGDGSGGVWIPVGTGSPPAGSMEHYGNGKLTSVRLPFTPAHLSLSGVASGPRSTRAFALGITRKSFSARTTTAVLLQFG